MIHSVTSRKKFWIRGTVFLLLAFIIFVTMQWVFMPKNCWPDSWQHTSTLVNFYEMERDSVDVLFLGSSHAMASFIPQDLYDQYGIRSYNLGTPEQSLLISYYWLKEALQYQHPSVVVLETLMCYKYCDEPLNTHEANLRYGLDPMRWSSIKAEAISSICSQDPDQTVWSYYNLFERFHTRWKSLSSNDFTFIRDLQHSEMKG